DHALLAQDLDGLALEDDRDVDGDRGLDVDGQEVDVQHVAAHRMPLQLLHDGLGGVAVDLQGQQRVEAHLRGQRRPQVAPVDAERGGLGAAAVQHGGDLPRGAQAPGCGRAGGAAGLGRVDDVVRHRVLLLLTSRGSAWVVCPADRAYRPGRRWPKARGGPEAGDQDWLAPPKSSETEVSSKTASMASAMTRATDSTSSLSICFSAGSGSVFVTTTLLIAEFLSRSIAGPDSTPWVAAAHTWRAPFSSSTSAAATIVPPVSIMSSMSTQVRP